MKIFNLEPKLNKGTIFPSVCSFVRLLVSRNKVGKQVTSCTPCFENIVGRHREQVKSASEGGRLCLYLISENNKDTVTYRKTYTQIYQVITFNRRKWHSKSHCCKLQLCALPEPTFCNINAADLFNNNYQQ